MESIRQLPEQYDVITSTVDFSAGEIGTIYQACNFVYVGSMRESNPNIYEPRQGTAYRFGVKLDGKLYGPRAIRNKVGSQKKRDILNAFPEAEFIPQHNKHRYFYFRGNKTNRKNLRRAIGHLEKPYPKRAKGAGE